MSKTIKIIFLVIVFSVVLGCTPQVKVRQTVPSYFVMLSDWNVYQQMRCSGFAVNEHTVVTAAHCFTKNFLISRILTQYNQEVHFTSYKLYPNLDLAIIKTPEKIYAEEYPKFAKPEYKVGQSYGLCTLYFFYNARNVLHLSKVLGNPLYDKTTKVDKVKDFSKFSSWLTVDPKQVICLSDSGGIIRQDGKIVGMVSEILSLPLVGMSTQMIAIDGDAIYEKLQELELEMP